jgi:acyl transferase domain-containing protein
VDPEVILTHTDYDSALAIVGMSGRFPGARDVAELWANLLDGAPGLRLITDGELAAAGVDPATADHPDYVRVGGPVSDLDQFDAGAFGFSPREAETLDPQHRMFLECSWEALESAGYCPVEPGPQVGVFGGCAYPDYLMDHLMPTAGEPGATLLLAIGNERDSLTSLVSYKLGLTGPSVAVQTFCSTSLVAVHLACHSLLTYECDIALAGGAFLPLPQPTGYQYEPGGILSPDGRLRSFDASANGSVMGAGVGVVALKRMQDALADGDVIHAVVLGSAVNNDGRARVGYTAPGVDGQASVVETAQAVAGVKPESIGYVECHATGTQLGDSIELAALTRVFPESAQTPTVLSSVKPSLGHLDRAAGVTGLIRASLSLRHAILPGTPGFEAPNEALAAAGGRFTVSASDRPWPAGPLPRRAGVNSFGLGGTNAHVVLEEPPARPARPAESGPHLLTLSAADPAALAQYAERLADHLSTHPDEELGDVSFTLQVSRGHFGLRRAVVCRDAADAVAALGDADRWIDGETRRRDPSVRLVAGEADPAWWREVARATARLLAADGDVHMAAAAEATTTQDEALAILTEGLSRVGVRFAGRSGPAAADAVTVLVEPDGSAADAWILSALARLWQAGATIDWAGLHRGRGRRVTLPTYPFQRSRYWVAARPAAAVTAAPAEGRVDDLDRWTYLPAWERSTPPAEDLEARLRAAGPWLVLAAEERGEALVERLIRAGAEVFTARPGERFGQDEIGDFTVRPGDPGDAAELIGSLLVAPATIVHGFSLASPPGDGAAHFDAQSELGFSSALAVVRALVEDPDPWAADLVLLTGGAVGVVGSDLTHPEHAGLASLAPTIAQENPRLTCRSVDVGEAGAGGTARAAGAAHGVAADAESVLAAIVAPHAGSVAVRGGEVWLRVFEQHPLPVPDALRPALHRGDTVLITGGLGALGLTLARHLTDVYGCRLVLTGRTPLPPRELWPQLKDGADRTARQIRAVLDLEDRGARVLALAADVDDEEQMRGVVEAAVERFGGIDVVVHGAGVQDPRFFDLVHLVEPEVCDAHFRAKVHGFHVLQKVLGDHAADRRLAVSSLTPVLGGVLHGPYAAANAVLDAYARAARLRGEGRWVTVNFEAWHAAPDLDAVGDQPEGDYEMAPAEGVSMFERALAAVDRVAHVTVSTGPLAPRVRRWVVSGGVPDAPDLEAERDRHPRPPLSTPYVEPAEGLETTVARVWEATLGLETVGAKDDFFELGGNSLIAIDLTARLREAVACAVAVTALVRYPTVRSLTRLITETMEQDQVA